MAEKKTPALLIEDNRYCPGCGHGIINRILAEVLEENGPLPMKRSCPWRSVVAA